MTYIFYYILAGILFNLSWDIMCSLLKREDIRLSLSEKAWHLIIWPITTIAFLYAFTISIINQIRGNDKD